MNASPQALAALTGDEPPAPAEGAQLKVNMLLKRLPRLRDSSVDPREAFAGTFHIAEGTSSWPPPTPRPPPASCPRPRPPRSTATR